MCRARGPLTVGRTLCPSLSDTPWKLISSAGPGHVKTGLHGRWSDSKLHGLADATQPPSSAYLPSCSGTRRKVYLYSTELGVMLIDIFCTVSVYY